jgi:hypothetical protein
MGQHPIEFTLFANKAFIFKNINLQDSIIRGNWDIDNFMIDIKFSDPTGAVLSHGYKKILGGKTFIILNDNKQKMNFRKIE